ncbi:MAG: chemotaxis protein CheD [Gemmatimonadota bacterium]
MTEREIVVRVADLNVGSSGDVLVTYGLGSCVAIILYDPARKVGGLAHIMLPSRSLARRDDIVGKTPQTGVPALIERLVLLGGNARRMTGRLVGGASLFASLTPPGSIQMGERNVVASREVLHQHGIPITGELVGGETGRSVWFSLAEGTVTVRSANQCERTL